MKTSPTECTSCREPNLSHHPDPPEKSTLKVHRPTLRCANKPQKVHRPNLPRGRSRSPHSKPLNSPLLLPQSARIGRRCWNGSSGGSSRLESLQAPMKGIGGPPGTRLTHLGTIQMKLKLAQAPRVHSKSMWYTTGRLELGVPY